MNKLEALNVVMEKQEHGVAMPMALKISVGGKWHTVTVDREDRDIQKIVRVLVMMMLRSEVDKTSKVVNRSEELLTKVAEDYIVRVRIGSARNIWNEFTVRAYSPRDARVMAFLLSREGYPDAVDQETVIAKALANTELV